jgi:hypothetical protein
LCILRLRFCEFRGWNQQCTACAAEKAQGCSFKSTAAQLERFLTEAAPWFDSGARSESSLFNSPVLLTLFLGTWYLVAEMHASYVRAFNAQREAAISTIEFEDRFLDFHNHTQNTINMIGSENFSARFSEENSDPALLSYVNDLVEDYNDIEAQHLERLSEDHVNDFDEDRVAHGDKTISGRRFNELRAIKPIADFPGARSEFGSEEGGKATSRASSIASSGKGKSSFIHFYFSLTDF